MKKSVRKNVQPKTVPPKKRSAKPTPALPRGTWAGLTHAPFAQSGIGARLAQMREAGSASQQRLADFVLRHPLRIAAASIEDFSVASGVSAPTISRFARGLGFSGYAEFRTAAAETLQALVEPVAKLRERFEREGGGAGVIEDGLAAASSGLAAAFDSSARARIEAAARKAAQARCVYVMGFGLSAHAAGVLALHLQPYCALTVTVVEFGGTEVAAGRLMNIGAGDVLIAISFPRYADDVVRLARFARDRGAGVIAITDSVASPLARYADDLLIAPSAHPVLAMSLVPAMAVIETLTAALMASDRENVDKAARLTEAISGYLFRGSGSAGR